MRKLLFFLTLINCFCLAFSQNHSQETEEWLLRLDTVLQQRASYDAMKLERIAEISKTQSRQRTPHELISFNTMLYDECYVFNSDLALECVNQNIELSQQINDAVLCAEWKIKKSFILSATGLLKESLDEVSSIKLDQLPNSVKIAYYSQLIYAYSHAAQYAAETGDFYNHYYGLEQAYNDSITSLITSEDPEFLWHDVWHHINSGDVEPVLNQLKERVAQSPMLNRYDAMAAYALAIVYKKLQEEDLMIRYLAMSGIADIRCSNKDIASIQELSEILFKKGEVSRAYKYMNICLQTTQEYKNRVRSVSIARVYESILEEFMNRDEVQRANLARTNNILKMLVGFILLFSALLIVSLLRLRSSSKELNKLNLQLEQGRNNLATANENLTKANNSLQEANDALKVVNAQLMDSNNVKEEYVGYVFAICSKYISKLEEYRKDINRKAKAKMLGEILATTEKQTLVQDELKEFYHQFDEIFLHIYPNFVKEFNALLVPEEQIEPRKGELLNTDLRIYALVRLGINDSVKISEFLHCSPQTIYNNRLKIRNKIVVSKEEFSEAIKTIGCATD